MWSVLRLVLLLGVLAGGLATAGAAFGDSGTTVTKGHFEYQLFDESIGMYVNFVCNETRVETGNAVRETIHCMTNDYTHRSAVVFSPSNLIGGQYYWYSDFTGDQSTDFNLAGTPSGNLEGWATY